MGAAWGLSIPLTKITVSTGYGQFGLIFWQFVIAVIVLGFVLIVRRKRPLVERKTIFLFIVLALLGTIFPNSASYVATYYLPASFMAILIATAFGAFKKDDSIAMPCSVNAIGAYAVL